jgi:hypothetical protein
MHATTEQLLSLRDGQPVEADAAAHVAGCASCNQALAGLERVRTGLRSLPELDPPTGAWSAVTARNPVAAAPAAPAHRYRILAAGMAAGFALAVALLVNLGRAPETEEGPVRGSTTDLIAATPAPTSSVRGVTTAELLETSRQLEAALRALPAAPQVTRARTALTIAELQDRIYEVDALLNDPRLDATGERTLWEQRVRLMDTLMEVRYAQFAERR